MAWKEKTMDILNPGSTLLIKLGSLVVHYQEFTSPDGHPFDKKAIEGLEQDPDVIEWLERMTKAAFLPVKRNNPKPVPYSGKLKRGTKSS